jgi:hypothetical protein
MHAKGSQYENYPKFKEQTKKSENKENENLAKELENQIKELQMQKIENHQIGLYLIVAFFVRLVTYKYVF